MKRDSARAPFDIISSGVHWRMRAEEIRTLADDAEEATARAMMLRIVADYDRLAKWAEDRSPGDESYARASVFASSAKISGV
jgi:hypothetical protein